MANFKRNAPGCACCGEDETLPEDDCGTGYNIACGNPADALCDTVPGPRALTLQLDVPSLAGRYCVRRHACECINPQSSLSCAPGNVTGNTTDKCASQVKPTNCGVSLCSCPQVGGTFILDYVGSYVWRNANCCRYLYQFAPGEIVNQFNCTNVPAQNYAIGGNPLDSCLKMVKAGCNGGVTNGPRANRCYDPTDQYAWEVLLCGGLGTPICENNAYDCKGTAIARVIAQAGPYADYYRVPQGYYWLADKTDTSNELDCSGLYGGFTLEMTESVLGVIPGPCEWNFCGSGKIDSGLGIVQEFAGTEPYTYEQYFPGNPSASYTIDGCTCDCKPLPDSIATITLPGP